MQRTTVLVLSLALAALGPAAIDAQLLGRISFPNSGGEEAQDDFVEGVLYLHNFEYEDAARAFRRAQETDPGFALAYWGEAMTHNHPLWNEQDIDSARAILERLAPTPEKRAEKAATERERGYLRAVETLFGLTPETADLDKKTRDRLYRDEMRRLSDREPGDHEAKAFYSLSILGASEGGRDFAAYMRAAAVAQEVWDVNREHPGAAHYLIHSFDDPVHAPLGLPMARVYSRIAPSAAHAQHMTSHIFVALGMWDKVAHANETARRVQNDREAELEKPLSVCSHYPYWLLYAYLQQGRLSAAETVLGTCRDRVLETPEEVALYHYRAMRARYVVDSARWDAVEDWPDPEPGSGVGAEQSLFVDAYAGWKRGSGEALSEALEGLAAVAPSEWPRLQNLAEITGLELEGLMALDAGDEERAVETLRRAAEAEAEMPYAFGPPELAKPVQELLGEILLASGRHDEALDAFEAQLERTPQRTTSLAGLARAAEALGDAAGAAEARRRLAEIWSGADPDLPDRAALGDDRAEDAAKGDR